MRSHTQATRGRRQVSQAGPSTAWPGYHAPAGRTREASAPSARSGLAHRDLRDEDRAHLTAATRQIDAADERTQVAPGAQLLAVGQLHDERARLEGDLERIVLVLA